MYLTNFKNKEDVIENYDAPANALDDAIVYLAWYGYGSYSGDSLVIFEKNGKLYEVHGSHCSCYGLEGQWVPEETSWEAIKRWELDYEDGAKEANEALKKLVQEHLEP